MMKPFPWHDAIAFGIGVLKLSPQEFWAMTPRELALAIEGARGGVSAPMNRAALDALIAEFPDRKRGETHGD